MSVTTAGQLHQAGVARLLAGVAAVSVGGAVLDSRQASPQHAFIARKGQQLDGHDFVAEACQRGARLLLLERHWAAKHPDHCARWQAQGATIMATDSGDEALFAWARWHRKRLSHTRLLAITGSYGKTTTKQLIDCCLSPYRRLSCAPGNWNALPGVALSLIRVPMAAEDALFECGIDHRGEMAEIASLLRPDQVLLTAIGAAHLQGLGDEQTVAWEKSRLYQDLAEDGVIFLPEDDHWYRYLRAQVAKGSVISFGNRMSGWGGYHDCGLEGGLLRLGKERQSLPLYAYKSRGIQAAVAVARHRGLSDRQIVRALAAFSAPAGRGELVRGRYLVLHDCYNAPKESVLALLDWLGRRREDGSRYFVVLGDLMELGPESAQHHREIGRRCPAGANLHYLFFGEGMRHAYQHCLPAKGQTCWQEDYHQAAQWLAERLHDGDVLVLKGARAMELERLLPLLEEGADRC